MRKADKIIVPPECTVGDVLAVIDQGVMQIALVVQDGKLLGTITDGDARRGILAGKQLNDSIEGLYNKEPVTADVNLSKEDILQIALARGVKQVPLVDDHGNVVGIEHVSDYLWVTEKPNLVVLMAGGLGTRLRPLTDHTPKPMLTVGSKPILETIITSLARYGFRNFLLSVNYRAEQIQEYFKDGSTLGVSINYLVEGKRMGTAGALSLVEDEPQHPVIVMNGDLLTGLNFEHLLNYHLHTGADATMCVRDYEFQVPFGVVQTKGARVTFIEEKPVHHCYVNAGIYVLQPDVLKMVPPESYYDMPQLFEQLIGAEKKVCSFPVKEYWFDIGQPQEFEKARNEYDKYAD